ncbi:metalloregulator ArsR/SmtB family transcription factor [Actinomadura welshii]
MDAYGAAGLGLLGDPTRRAIFELLARGPCSVGELARQLPVSRPAVSQHLRLLKGGGLVLSRPEGTRRIYRLDPDGLTALRAYLDRTASPWPPSRPDQPAEWNGTAHTVPVLRGTVTVRASVHHAFGVFTHSFRAWWPHRFHFGRWDSAEVILGPGAGGRWYERGEDGGECDWGRVLIWEPPHRLVVTWQISGRWEFDPVPEHASEIEVRFVRDAPGLTTVDLEHRNIGRVVGGRDVYGALAGCGGWTVLLARFAETAAATAPGGPGR